MLSLFANAGTRSIVHVLNFLQLLRCFFRNWHGEVMSSVFLLAPLFGFAQQPDSLRKVREPLPLRADSERIAHNNLQVFTRVKGQVTDAVSGQPLPSISIRYGGSGYGTSSDKDGRFTLAAPGLYTRVSFSYVGYQSITKIITPGQTNVIQVQLRISQTQLKEVSILSSSRIHYRNKGNPAVELIQKVIDHKDQNKMEHSEYLQYDQYERIGLSFFDLPSKLIRSRFFNKYKFMLDNSHIINGQQKTTFPVYISEKVFRNYYRKSPEKSIQILDAQKQINLIKFIDTAGVDIYLNRLYGNNIDIYSNNIFIITNQFLSPIADHAPEFYRFYILDTLQTDKGKLVELSFMPRNTGDLLFEGKLTVTLDGNYAVESCELNVNKRININFMRDLQIRLDFGMLPSRRYYLSKSDVKANFALLKHKGTGVFGERTVSYSNYKLNEPLDPDFYQGQSDRSNIKADQQPTLFWDKYRGDTLADGQVQTYARLNRLQSMTSYKVASWLATTFVGNYANVGPLQLGQISDAFSFDNLEGSRFQIGGRTTPDFNRSIYLDGYLGYGTGDKQFKYNIGTYLSLNKIPFYRYPNHYFKASYQYDISIPGQNFSVNTSQPPLASFQSGPSDYFLYSKIIKLDYVKEFNNHFSFDIAFKSWDQRAAGNLVYRLNDMNHTLVGNLLSNEIDLSLRYAPHEQLIQGTVDRRTIYSKYPITKLQIRQGLNAVMTSSRRFTNINASIEKRFYLSQLGYADFTLLGSYLIGKVPFPLLNISPANESIAYDPEAYNKMYYLEFVSDHYAGINFTQSFNGFILNKIPLIKHLKWREFLSFKAIYGGLRLENNPVYTTNLYDFPKGTTSTNGTYALGHIPYVEAGAGIGNIFKILRIDIIKRFNYLNHPGITPYGIKFSFSADF